MFKDLRVDVVIPTYNGGRYIKEAIDSVLKQTLPANQIIVVDDASTEDINSKLKIYGDRIKIVRHQNNCGPAAARNTGIKAGCAPLIAFLDDDDVWAPDKLERQLPEFQMKEKPGLCYSSLIDCDANLSPQMSFRRQKKRSNEYVFHELYIEGFTIPTSTVVVLREAIERCGMFNESMTKSQDFECWLRMAMLYTVSCVPEPLCYRRHHTDTISASTPVSERLNYMLKAFDLCKDAAYKNKVVLPIPVEQRKVMCIRRRMYSYARSNSIYEFNYCYAKLNTIGVIQHKDKLFRQLLLIFTRFKSMVR